jgi:hypothetical protein
MKNKFSKKYEQHEELKEYGILPSRSASMFFRLSRYWRTHWVEDLVSTYLQVVKPTSPLSTVAEGAKLEATAAEGSIGILKGFGSIALDDSKTSGALWHKTHQYISKPYSSKKRRSDTSTLAFSLA